MMKSSGNIDDNQFRCEVEADLRDAIEHGILVSILARKLSEELGKDEQFCYDMSVAGLLHDIGKMKLSRYLYWRRDDSLEIEEMKYVRLHSKLSYEILKDKGYSDTVLDAIHYHHENYDGSGYPNNLKDEDIPEGARILRACDVFAALVTDRPYRTAFDMNTAIELMIEEVRNFDLAIFMAFQNMVNYNDFTDIVYNGLFENEDTIDEYIKLCLEEYDEER